MNSSFGRSSSKAGLTAAIVAVAMCAHASRVTAAVCAGGATVQGVDVSSSAGAIDWNSVAGSGRSFAYARVSDGTTFVDPDFDQNYAGIAAAGMARGAYQFFEPAQDPVAQAKLLLQKIVLPLQPGDLPPMLDLEVTGGQPAATIAANIESWVTTIRSSTGRSPVIYTSPFFWNSSVQATTFGTIPLWVSQTGVSCPTLPDGWTSWMIWQYSFSGSVSGITGAVDLDEFNGSQQDLNAAAANDFIFVDGFE
jgi:lysozyme